MSTLRPGLQGRQGTHHLYNCRHSTPTCATSLWCAGSVWSRIYVQRYNSASYPGQQRGWKPFGPAAAADCSRAVSEYSATATQPVHSLQLASIRRTRRNSITSSIAPRSAGDCELGLQAQHSQTLPQCPAQQTAQHSSPHSSTTSASSSATYAIEPLQQTPPGQGLQQQRVRQLARRRRRSRSSTPAAAVHQAEEPQRGHQLQQPVLGRNQLQQHPAATACSVQQQQLQPAVPCPLRDKQQQHQQQSSDATACQLGVLLLQQAGWSHGRPVQQPARPVSWPSGTRQPAADTYEGVAGAIGADAVQRVQQLHVWLDQQSAVHPSISVNTEVQRQQTSLPVSPAAVDPNTVIASSHHVSSASTFSRRSAAVAYVDTISSSSHSRNVESLSGDEQQRQLLQLEELLASKGIWLPELRFGQQRTECPKCNNGSQQENCFAVRLDPGGLAMWQCHRASCGYSGSLRAPGQHRAHGVSSTSSGMAGRERCGSVAQQATIPPIPTPGQLQPLSDDFLQWFRARGISAATLQRNRVAMETRYSPALRQTVPHIAFPFFHCGDVVNVKYRALPKHFVQLKGGQQVFYGLDDIKGASDVIIVEGELDKLAVEEATGITAVLSMPAGAASPKCQPQQQRQQLALQDSSPGVRDVHNDKKFACVYRAQHLLAGCSRIIIALDGDEPGFYTACGLAQRLGPERCLYLPWPAAAVWGTDALQHVAAVARQQYGIVVDIAAGAGCKDANDVLMVYGREFLQSYLEQAPCLFADLLAAGVTG